jgi:DNA polymerase-3 subunit gamma/tau
VPITILSRCQRYDFKRLSTSAIQAHLTRLADREGWHLAPEGLQLIAQEAEGGMRDAQGLLDQVITFGGPEFSLSEIARILGVTDRRLLLETLEAIMHRQGARLLEIIADCHDHGHDLRRFYQDLLFFCRHLVIASLGPEARHLTDIADQEWDSLQKLARQTSLAHLFNLLTTLLKGEEELRRSPLPRLSLEISLLKLVSLEPLLDLPDWLDRLAALESRLESTQTGQAPLLDVVTSPPPAPRAPEVPSAEKHHKAAAASLESAPEPTPVDPERWQLFLQFVEKTGGAPLAGKLHGSRFLKQEDGRLYITPAATWRLAQPQHLEQVQALARQFFGQPCQLEFAAPTAANSQNKPDRSPRQLSLEEVKHLAGEIFDGTWLHDSPQTSTPKEDS